MDPTLKAFLLSWEWRIDVIAVLLTFATLYTIGWIRLRRMQAKIATVWRLASYYSGLAFLAIALMSGFDTFQTQLFFIHMAQHILMIMYAPPLLFLANPIVFIMWAIPRVERQQISRLLTQKSLFRRALVTLSAPGIVWLAYTCNLALWHDPRLYNRVVTDGGLLHDFQHITFFVTGMGIWWHISGAYPKFHGGQGYIMRMAMIVAIYFVDLFIGIALTMTSSVIYTHYLTVPRIGGISPQRDQMIGGLLMWLHNGMMYQMVFIGLGALQVRYSEKRSRLRDKHRQLKKLQGLAPT